VPHAPDGFTIYAAAPDVWHQRPKLASHIATISQIWALIEYDLVLIFVVLSGSNLAMGAVFTGVVPIQTRLTMIQKLVAAFLQREDRVAWQSLRSQIEKMAGQRNTIVHGFWSIREEEPDTIFRQERFPLAMARAKPVPYTHDTFIDVQNQLNRLRSDLAKFSAHVDDLAREQPFPRSFLLT
jgi:hypothetical protein